eukprot:TRINITY_DN1115_c0_g1_i1.p1 TRINITY_DN1115_c0_g1~~TRINITY_DN1115_c0_g1_i1.p1  ORF type:complete len:430 (-),score=184.80 TRINITY_DN1115_c0_g1_i1:118-1407(-)
MAQYDLTHENGKYLDRHLVLPLLEFLELQEVYPEKELLQGKLDALACTNMVDFQMDTYKKLHGLAEDATDEKLAEMEARKTKVVEELERLSEEAAPILRIVGNESIVQALRKDKMFSVQHLVEEYELTVEQVHVLYRFAKAQYMCGNYTDAAEYLFHYIPLSSGCPDRQSDFFSALWGKFLCEILMQNWDTALEDMNRLKEVIASRNFGTAADQLQQRTWLIHWSLFIFFNHPNGRNGIVDLCFQDKYMNAIQTTCPHILRYLTTAVISNKKRRNMVKETLRVLEQERGSYSDPITEFLECLFLHFDFDGAQKKLQECDKVLQSDFFLVGCRDEFIENARIFMFETYCRIHKVIDIKMLSHNLNMDADEAERWIVNLIRNAHLDAKIDSARGHVIMGSQFPSVYQQVIDKTKSVCYRSHLMANSLSKLE